MGIPELRFDVLVNMINDELRPRRILIDEMEHPKTRMYRIVTECLKGEKERRALVSALGFLCEGSTEAEKARRMVSLASPLMTQNDELRVEELLRGCSVDNLSALYRAAVGRAVRPYPHGLTGPGEIFVYLLDSNTRPGRLSPHLRFLALLVQVLPRQKPAVGLDLVSGLRRWLYQQRDLLRADGNEEAAAELELLLTRPYPFPERTDFPICLTIEIDRLPVPNDARDLHIVSHWRQFDHVQWCPVRGEDREVPLAEVVTHVLDLVMEAETGWGYGIRAPLLLEFVLPPDLINLEVDRWLRPTPNGLPPRTLGMDYEVVIRSDTRLRPRDRHRLWWDRWERFMSENGGTYLVPLEEPANLVRLRQELDEGEHLVVCVLSTPPDREPGHSELGVAVDAGIPIILWCRNAESNDDFRDVVAEAVQPARLKKLPKSIMGIRRSVGRSASRAHWNIGMLWDDPTRDIPPADPLKAPA
nr:hypothetical protein [Planomonospora venezuelensis]